MKIIHCADLHLDSKMRSRLDKEKARERKSEILHTYERMVEYAAGHGVSAILIAGDMFDTKDISAKTRNTVLAGIRKHPDITFFYLRGNHDKDSFLSILEEPPKNLRLFHTEWTTYETGAVSVSGIEFSGENSEAAYNSLVLDAGRFNIVMLHGQENEGNAKDKTEVINLKALRNKGIDYLALGHVHFYKKEKLDGRGTYCYPGCLEGRSFDECGEHGFVVLDIDEAKGTCTQEFVPFAYRRLYEVFVDVTGCTTTAEMYERTAECIEELGCPAESFIKIVLCGTVDVECEKDPDYIAAGFGHQFYYVKAYDETRLKVDIEDYMLDESLKGELVRTVMQDAFLSEEDKSIIIRYGLQALAGEEVL